MIARLRCGIKQTEFIDLVADYGGRWAEVWVRENILPLPYGSDVQSRKVWYMFSLEFIIHIKKVVLYYLSTVALGAAPKGCERRAHAHHA